MVVAEDRILKVLREFCGSLPDSLPKGYALLNINDVAKTDRPWESWGTLDPSERQKFEKLLDEKERELAHLNVRVIWYSAPNSDAFLERHESAKRQLLSYILEETREKVRKAEQEKQKTEAQMAKYKTEREIAKRKRQGERLLAEFNGKDPEGSDAITAKENIDKVILSEEQLKQVRESIQGEIRMMEGSPTKYAITFPAHKIGGGIYEIRLVAENGKFYLSDNGATYAELDKIFELKEPDVIKNLVAILKQYGCRKEGTAFVIDCTLENVPEKMSYLIQALSFMLNMKIFYV